MKSSPLVSIIILNLNGERDTLECLESLSQLGYSKYQIILVDNGSTDGVVNIVQERFPEIILLQNTENLGFAEGNNVGIRYALSHGADYILLLNNDTVVDPSFLTQVIEIGEEHPTIGMLSPLIFWHAEPEKLWFYSAEIDWTRGYCNHKQMQKRPTLDQVLQQYPDVSQHDYWSDTDYLSGCALLVKTEVIRTIGELDARFFAYYEDVDWCVRCQQAGLELAVVPSARIWHKVSATAGSARSQYFSARNTILLLWKYSGMFHLLIRLKRHVYHALAEYSWDREYYHSITDVTPLDGIWAGLQGKFGNTCRKMPSWLNTFMYRHIRYLLWCFGMPDNIRSKICAFFSPKIL